jgi:8-oxo-dGTP pyrophosphatase MutT (NUDIX family)
MREVSIRAAGGVVWRENNRELEVLLVYREPYKDWTFPKGKVEPGESDAECALREVSEETGLECRLGPELAQTRYRDPLGRSKVVRYWAMEGSHGHAVAQNEIADVQWLRAAAAREALTWDGDRSVLDTFVARGIGKSGSGPREVET